MYKICKKKITEHRVLLALFVNISRNYDLFFDLVNTLVKTLIFFFLMKTCIKFKQKSILLILLYFIFDIIVLFQRLKLIGDEKITQKKTLSKNNHQNVVAFIYCIETMYFTVW